MQKTCKIKFLFIVFAGLFLFNKIQAQITIEDSTIVEQYIEVTISPKLLSSRPDVSVDFGDAEPVALTKQQMNTIWQNVRKMATITAVLNYFGYNGWKLFSTMPIFDRNDQRSFKYYFKKKFRKDAIINNTTTSK